MFAAGCASAWASGADPVTAARVASGAAAWWCGTRVSQVPAEILAGTPVDQVLEDAAAELVPPDEPPLLTWPRRFSALLTARLVETCRTVLMGLGARVFSPLHEVGPGGDEVARRDLDGLDRCDAVLALLDGWGPRHPLRGRLACTTVALRSSAFSRRPATRAERCWSAQVLSCIRISPAHCTGRSGPDRGTRSPRPGDLMASAPGEPQPDRMNADAAAGQPTRAGENRVDAVLLLSGGLDSTALAALFRPALCLAVDYGQRSAPGELRAAMAICRALNLRVGHPDSGPRQARRRPAKNDEEIPGAPSPEWWPYRNQILVTAAASVAIQAGLPQVLAGSVAGDGTRHVDGGPAFYQALDRLISMQEGGIRVLAPPSARPDRATCAVAG